MPHNLFRSRPALLCLSASTLLTLASCARDTAPARKPTSPVTGQVLVDGKAPGSPIQVTCVSQSGIDEADPTVSSCLTDNDGNFAISTYENGDGVPPGDYVLTFMWGKMNMVKMGYGGPDKLKGRYADPAKSDFVVGVVEGLPADMGTIELTTEGPAE